jgi:hypothetical protein
VRDGRVPVAARVFVAGFAFSSSKEFAPLVRTLETCVIFFGDNGDCTAGVLARVCLAGLAASVGLVLAAGACCVSCGSSADFVVAVLVDRFGGGAGFVVLVFRVGSGATVSAFFALVARVVMGLGASSMLCNSSSPSSCSGSTTSVALVDLVARVARVFGAGAAAVFAVVDAVARLTGFLRSVKLASSVCGSSAGPVRAPRRVATIFAV